MTRLKSFILLFAIVTGVTACETIEGAGRDIEDAGQAISEAAEE